MTQATDPAEQAQALYDDGDFERSRAIALEGLSESPKDVALLRVAGKASLELNRDDATEYLEQAVNVDPENAEAWRDLADALLDRDRIAEATNAFRQALELRPDDVSGLIDLAHTAYAAGESEEALAALRQALERDPGNRGALRGLVEMHRRAGRAEDALAAASELAERNGEDVLALIDVAELSVALDRLDEAVSAYGRLREIDDDPEHEVYPYHGMIQAELRRDRWRRALDLAIDATRVDRYGRTTDILAFAVAQVFGASDRPAPSRAQVDATLAESQAEHRRLHTESVAF